MVLKLSPEHKAALMAGSKRRWSNPGAREDASKRMSGAGNPFYGKRHPPELMAVIAKKKEVNVDIQPTKEWGYFIGLVLGDGCVCKTNGGNFKISVASNKPEIVDQYYECVKNLGLNCGYEIRKLKECVNSFGNSKDEIEYRAVLLSKQVYEFMRPYKQPDFHFNIPNIVYGNMDILTGFMSGYFDAEGSIYKGSSDNAYTIACFSKHESNLLQIQSGLKQLGIRSYIQVRKDRIASQLLIARYEDRVKFRQLIGFRINRKQAILDSMNKPTNVIS